MSNLQIRIITAVVLGSFALWMTWLGGALYAASCCAISAVVLFEWNNLTAPRQKFLPQVLAWLFFFVFCVLLITGQPAAYIFLMLAFGTVVIAAVSGRNAGWTAGGFIYSTVPIAALALLRGEEPFGFGVIIFLYAIVWGTDISAYFIGRALGGPKLAPRFSPNKTWSGAIGGAMFAVVAGWLVAYFIFDMPLSNFYIPLLALLLSIVSQLGDIGESWVKRHFSAKDSGSLLPGHGGFMDRVDGLIVAAVVLYVIGALVSNADIPSNVFNFI